MALPFYNWSRTAASNATSDSTINWAEGQAPSSVNDSARAMMASTAAFRDDISGAIVTGGTATAYTVTSYQIFDTLAHMNGAMIAFTPHATSTNTVGNDVTLNVDGLGAKSIRGQPSVALPTGSLILGTPYVVTYNNSDGVWYLQGGSANAYSIPLGGGLDYWGSTAPNSAFAFPTGQAISRTTYATLFTLIGTVYGPGDGSTTFNLPDKTGRVSAMKEATATRLTTAGSGVDGGTYGATGGAQNVTMAQANLPNVTLSVSGSISVSSTPTNVLQVATTPIAYGSGGNAANVPNAPGTSSAIASTGTASLTSASINGNTSQTAMFNCQPTIICNYIIRVI